MREKPTVSVIEELKQPLAPAELEVLKNQLDSEQPDPSPQSKFNYAWGLLKCGATKKQREGLAMLSELYKDVPEMRRESIYYLSLGSYQVGDYVNARKYVAVLLRDEPENAQGTALKKAIEEAITRDGMIGLGVVGGALAIGVGLIGALARKKR